MGRRSDQDGKPVRVGISMGDPNGIGPELILKCFQDRRLLEDCEPVIYGSPELLSFYADLLNLDGLKLEEVEGPKEVEGGAIPIVRAWEGEFEARPGTASQEAGDHAYKAFARATQDIAEGELDALLTGPLNKHSVQREGRPFPGHTEYLTEYANIEESLMLMVNEGLRIGVVSGHVPLCDVPSDIDSERILRKLRIMEGSLIQDFRIEKPRIAVLGLNPHAGESGMLGTEEEEVIAPAVERARKEEGTYCFGPFPADGLFGSEEAGKYDGILAMYHDQGLTPFKALSAGQGVNFTAGLPIVRTSPDHGTAFSIAGQGKASPSSFRRALYLAIDLFRRRNEHKAMTADPLKPQKGSPYMKGDRS